DVSFEAWQEQLYSWRGQLSSLHLWSQYLNTKNALQNSNARMFVDSIEKRNIKKEDIGALVDGNFADSLLNILFVENHELATFVGELHENRIREFRDLDKKILVLNRKRIYHKLNSNIPKIFGGTENPQAKILAGEFTRKSGHMPVRKLLEKAGGMIKQIKPCFMMSPLSIAQYLDPTNEELQFDVVIFDEASQVKPEDALGAFMRGKTAVVMGDTQQLPPTSFFDQMSDAESDEEEATSLDMESILHLCKLSFPVKMLKWHYRSRHESLITVSNREFYDDDLLVYPSPSHNDPELGLKFHYNPNTAYHRGSSSANPLEAEDVADEIFNHFEKYGDTKSLGVGTFSVAQKNAILEALEVKRKERPEFEPLFSDNKEERFFVKNLETIQGDERDVILISVGYGFDEDRKMSLNFGPLNQDGGERRLNVLITRAREKCVVFSNFKAYDMKLTANPPYGVKSLKEFLEYAENLTLGTHVGDAYSHEPFEDAIANFLEENGYTVDRQIGCAGFRVDLAIVDDENPGKYILGITTDGKMYSSSKVARDRDRLREQVLNGLGWKLYHLWSTDWYRNRDLGRKKLLDFVEKSIRQTRAEEKRKSEEEKKLAEKRRIEAEKKAEELRIAREREEAEQQSQDDINIEDIGSSDFVEVEKVDDILEKPIDVSEIDPSEFFEEEKTINHDNIIKETPSEFVDVEPSSGGGVVEETPSEFVEFELSTNESSEKSAEFTPQENADNEKIPKEDIVDQSDVDEDSEVWESDEGVSPEDNAEVWENDRDYSEESDKPLSDVITDKFKSILKSDEEGNENEKDSIFSSIKFTKDLGEDSDFEKDFEEPVKEVVNEEVFDKSEKPIVEDDFDETTKYEEDEIITPKFGTKIDLGSDDDYIVVDHSDDEVVDKTVQSKSEEIFEDTVDLGSDDDYIYVDHSHDDERIMDDETDKYDFKEDLGKQEKVNEIHEEEQKPRSRMGSNVKSFISGIMAGESKLESKEIETFKGEIIEDDEVQQFKPAPNDDSVVEAEIVSDDELNIFTDDSLGKYDDELERPSPKMDYTEGDELNIFTDDSLGKGKRTNDIVGKAKEEFIDDIFYDEELKREVYKDELADDNEIHQDEVFDNDINEETPQNNAIFDGNDLDYNIKEETVPDDVEFEGNDLDYDIEEEVSQDGEVIIEDNHEFDIEVEESIKEDMGDGVTYYQGSNDVKSKLRKNNFYYEEEKPRSVRDSIRGIKKDMQYINKSLKEIENPTKIDYVSVVDRTEEYDPNDYLSRPSDDDSDIIIEKEEGLTFAEKEEQRIEKEMRMEALRKDVSDEKDVIVPVHEQARREELKDQALEDIILSANEDYREIEKQRHRQDNQLKAFDDQILPGKRKMEDEIIDYVEVDDIGINSSDELYKQPIDKVAKSIKEIVDVEGPIHVSEVTKRVKDSCNIKRAGSTLKKRVNEAIDEAENSGDIIKIGDFLYDASNNNIVIRKRNKPNIDLISDEEIAKSIETVLIHKPGITTGQIAKETSRNFGFKSTSKKTATRINSVLDLMIANNKVKIENDIVELK
uniref:DUF3320 domain-containing protein n=1 Tax=Methanobrevibacter sp. TaxID=66852 RepID=UPI00388DE2B9